SKRRRARPFAARTDTPPCPAGEAFERGEAVRRQAVAFAALASDPGCDPAFLEFRGAPSRPVTGPFNELVEFRKSHRPSRLVRSRASHRDSFSDRHRELLCARASDANVQ